MALRRGGHQHIRHPHPDTATVPAAAATNPGQPELGPVSSCWGTVSPETLAATACIFAPLWLLVFRLIRAAAAAAAIRGHPPLPVRHDELSLSLCTHVTASSRRGLTRSTAAREGASLTSPPGAVGLDGRCSEFAAHRRRSDRRDAVRCPRVVAPPCRDASAHPAPTSVGECRVLCHDGFLLSGCRHPCSQATTTV